MDLGAVRLAGEVFYGSVLGDYKGGILHTFNPVLDTDIRAVGGWAQLQFQISSRWSFAAGYGLDDTFNEDLSVGFRSYNDIIQANWLYNITRRLVAGLEVSRWKTNWLGLNDGRVVRIEPTVFYRF